MRTPSPDGAYHLVRFEHPGEAAAFVAALSRYLASPRSEAHSAHTSSALEVWCYGDDTRERVDVYLSDGALRATTDGFAAPPVVGVQQGRDLPEDCMLVFDGDDIPPLGMDDVQRLATRKR